MIIREVPDALEPERAKGEVSFEHVAFGYGAGEDPVLTRRLVHDQAGPGGRHRRADRQRQVDRGEPDAALLRPDRRPRADRRPGHRQA